MAGHTFQGPLINPATGERQDNTPSSPSSPSADAETGGVAVSGTGGRGGLVGGGGLATIAVGGKTDSSRAEANFRDVLNPTFVLANPALNLGAILQIANEGSVVNGGQGIIVNPPLFSGISGSTSLDTPFGGFSVGGNVNALALLAVGALVLFTVIRRRR